MSATLSLTPAQAQRLAQRIQQVQHATQLRDEYLAGILDAAGLDGRWNVTAVDGEARTLTVEPVA